MATAAEATGGFTQYIVIVSEDLFINDQAHRKKFSTAYNLYSNKRIYINETMHENGKMSTEGYKQQIAEHKYSGFTNLRFYEVLKYYDLMGVPQQHADGTVVSYFKLKPGFTIHMSKEQREAEQRDAEYCDR